MTVKPRLPYNPQTWENVSCLYCNSSRYTIYERYGCNLQFTYVKCADCGLIYQSQRPTYDKHFLEAAYGDYYFFKPDYQYSQKDLSGWEKEVKEILKFDNLHTGILEVGTAMGEFMAVAKKYYPIVEGIEVAENMANYVREHLQVKVFNTRFDDLHETNKYSCIHMSHVIEHVPNPTEWLNKVKEIIVPGGVLALSVPHMFSLDRRFKLCLKRIHIRNGRWKENWRTPDHLFEPTIPSTLKFFERNGFRVLSYYTYSRSDMDASTIFGKIYNRWLKLGSNLRFFVRYVNE